MASRGLIALLPFGMFLLLFLGTGIYFQMQGSDFAFYQLPAHVAIIPAIILAFLIAKSRFSNTLENFLRGIGHSDIMTMCLIYLLSGAFSVVGKSIGGVEVIVQFGLFYLPAEVILPGLFIISSLVSMAMGTSMGTIATVLPVAVAMADQGAFALPVAVGAVIGGAMFGDNLSIISDTTIAATRSQNCNMRDKFKINFKIALPAALITSIYYFFSANHTSNVSAPEGSLLSAIPYFLILLLALLGLNVFIVLIIGIIVAGVIGLTLVPSYTVMAYAKDMATGFSNMQEIFILSMMIGGLTALLQNAGGLEYIKSKIYSLAKGKHNHSSFGELMIGMLVFLVNLCTANNTVSIIVTGKLAREISEDYQVNNKRAAATLDIFSCISQGLIPYGAQALLAASTAKISPTSVVANNIYIMLLAVVTTFTIFLNKRRLKN